MIDNFDLIRKHLTFEKAKKMNSKTGQLEEINDTYDRYIVHIICRAKDTKKYGAQDGNRLIKTYEISSLDYFDKKREHIIQLCKDNNARAYILPQVRSTYDCLKEMIKIGVDNLENPTVKFQHILRSCLCAMHKSRDKKWILDCDSDNMFDYDRKTKWDQPSVVDLVKEELKRIGKSEDDLYVVPTKNGFHVVTPPFDLVHAQKKCGMLYDDVQRKKVDERWTGPDERQDVYENICGWLKKDGMTILYIP